MEATWQIVSPLPAAQMSALESAVDRAVDAYLEANPDCPDTFGEVLASDEVPDAKELAGKKKALPAPVQERLAQCHSVLTIERPGSLAKDPLQVSILRYVLEHSGEAVVVFDGKTPELAEKVLADLEKRKAAQGFGVSAELPPELDGELEPRAGRILSILEAAEDNMDLAIDLRASLNRASEMARRYVMLLMQEGAVDDERAARSLKMAPVEVAEIADEVERIVKAVRPPGLRPEASLAAHVPEPEDD